MQLHDDNQIHDRLMEQVEFYANAHGIETGEPEESGSGYVFGSNGELTLFFKPMDGEIGVMKNDEVHRYLETGFMPGQEGF